MGMTLEQYIKQEYAEGKIDFAFRASVHEGRVSIYIHPAGRSGMTTPPADVRGDEIHFAPTGDWFDAKV